MPGAEAAASGATGGIGSAVGSSAAYTASLGTTAAAAGSTGLTLAEVASAGKTAIGAVGTASSGASAVSKIHSLFSPAIPAGTTTSKLGTGAGLVNASAPASSSNELYAMAAALIGLLAFL
jgi:hypothetical protein